MLTPYAIIRTPADAANPADLTDHHHRNLRAIESFGLTLLIGDPIDPAAEAEGFMRTVAAIHESSACVPLRLDEPLADTTAATRLLETGADRFARLLDRLNNADEWSILVEPPRPGKPNPTPNQPLNQSLNQPPGSPDIAVQADPTNERPASAAKGRSYLEQRRRDIDTNAGIHPEVSALLARFAGALGPIARDTRTLAVPTPPHAGSLALLIDRDQDPVGPFRDTARDAPLPCALSGPWPPFSFVSLAN